MHRLLMCVFFFKQKTAYEMRISDWSSDVCSSDLFRVAGVAGREVELAIVNCGASAYPDGWPGYKARYSEDRDNWLLADTGYADGTLTIRLSPDSNAVWLAYFAPYSMERHTDLVAWAAPQPGVGEGRKGKRQNSGPEM